MSVLTGEDWSELTDDDLHEGIGITLMAASDPMCDPTVTDDLLAFAEDIRAELKRRRTRAAGGHEEAHTP